MAEIAAAQLYAIAGFLTVAMITPGPNNTIVLTAAKHDGLSAAIRAMLGVVSGSLALLALVWAGARIAFELVPSLHLILAMVGACYVGGLGAILIWQASRDASARKAANLPSTTLGLAVFQFLNPKAWVLLTTAVAASPRSPIGLMLLSLLVVMISGLCLTLWACAGTAIARCLKEERSHRWFDRAMGLLLIGSALLLILEI